MEPTAVNFLGFSISDFSVLGGWSLALLGGFALVLSQPFVWRWWRKRADTKEAAPELPAEVEAVDPVAPVAHRYAPRKYRESRRMEAWDLYQQGVPQVEIARRFGVTRGAVSQWVKAANEYGAEEGLQHRSSPGRPTRLSQEQLQRLLTLLAVPPLHYGMKTNRWTYPLIAEFVEREFGVPYHPVHLSRVLQSLGWNHKAQ